MSVKTGSFENLEVWRISMDLVKRIYSITKSFPSEERYCLVDQIRRSAISIPSNLAEGYSRTTHEFARFITISHGSTSELKTQIIISYEIGYLEKNEFQNLIDIINRISKMLKSLEIKIRAKNTPASNL